MKALAVSYRQDTTKALAVLTGMAGSLLIF